MKKLIVILLALILCCSAAAAEVSVTAKPLDKDQNPYLMYSVNLLTVYKDRLTYLADKDLNILSDGYYTISNAYGADTVLMVREPENGLYGIISTDGKVIVPTQYHEIEVFSNNWTAGIMLAEATADNYDYQTLIGDKKYFLIDSVDIWFGSEKIGTLTRSDYKSASAYGDYLYVRTRDDQCVFYNNAFEKSPGDAKTSSEYSEEKGVVTHNGSGMQAFTAGCTLTPGQVRQFIYEDYRAKALLDLQGNVVADLSVYDSCSVNTNSNTVSLRTADDKKGLMDSTGKIILECKYDDIDYDVKKAQKMGWIKAVKDGKAGFVSLVDGTESGFEYREDAVKQQGWFFVVEDPKEGTILISPLGEIPTRFFEAEPDYYAPYAVVRDTENSKYKIIGLDGKELIPDLPEISYASSVSCSYDGSMILVSDKDYNKTLYLVSTAE